MQSMHLRLPATSANLGPGFDALGLAMRLFLNVKASAAEGFAVEATGRDAAMVGSLEGNLLLETYRDLCGAAVCGGAAPVPLRLVIHNEIPLGMGCGSSAAALLAGVMLANHFGELGLTPEQVLMEACRREGHPDNVAACFYGGLTASSMMEGQVATATLGQDLAWRLLIALPGASLATSVARALLPEHPSRADAVTNIQNTALLVAAFALGRPELLAAGMRDRMHQPFRAAACPLLPRLLPLAGQHGIYSVTLSGAGPSILLIANPKAVVAPLLSAIREAAREPMLEIVETRIAHGASAVDL